LSKDGSKVYFTAAIDGTKQLFEVNFPGMTSNKCATDYKRDFDVNDLIGFRVTALLLPEQI
jgi:Tol biopolymer transport system component